MKSLNPNNRNPRNGLSYTEIVSAFQVYKVDQIRVGNNTVAEKVDSFEEPVAAWINVVYYSTKIANLFSNDEVQIYHGGYKTDAAKDRLDWVLLPLGFRLTSIKGKWKIYSIATGAYRDYFAGMVVTRGGF
jgi:hypothetical protein